MPNFFQLTNAFYGQVCGRNRWRIRQTARQTLSMSADDIRQNSLNLFQSRVWGALQRFPFYRDFFVREMGNLPDSLGDITPSGTPIWTRANQQDLYNTENYSHQIPQKSFPHSTGGSTGQPMRFYVTFESYEWRRAMSDRGYSWAGAEEGRKSFYVWGTSIETPPLRARIKSNIHHLLERRTYFDSFHFNDERKEQCVRSLNRKRPHTLVGYAGNLVDLALFLEKHPGLLDFRVEAIIPAAEGLHPGQRELLESVFGGKVFMSYGSREFMLIGMECKEHCGYHLSADNLYVEVVDEKGDACKPGETGRILVTDLHNDATPFIRYEIGDVGIANDNSQPCPCGNPLPLLAAVEGRIQENIILPDGEKLTALFIPHLMKEFPWVNGYQIRQNSPGDITVNLRTGLELSSDLTGPIARALRDRTCKEMRIGFETVDKLRRTLSGKTPTIEPPDPDQYGQANIPDPFQTSAKGGNDLDHPPTPVAHLVMGKNSDLLDDVLALAAGRNEIYPDSTFVYVCSTPQFDKRTFPNVPIRRLKRHRLAFPWSRGMANELVERLYADNIQIIHSHDEPAQLYAALATAKTAIGHIFTCHNKSLDKRSKVRWRTLALGRVTDAFAAESNDGMSCLIQRYGIKKEKILAIRQERHPASELSVYEHTYHTLGLKYHACKQPFEAVFGSCPWQKTTGLRMSWLQPAIVTQLRYHGITARLVPRFVRRIAHWFLPDAEADRGLWMASYQNVLRQAKPAKTKRSDISVAIVKDLMLRHSYYEAACLELGVPYQLVDITGDNWVDTVKSCSHDIWLVRPFVQNSIGKHLYDERLKVMKEQMGCKLFPDLAELWLYESKRRVADWLAVHNIPHPETHVFINRAGATAFARSARYPLVFKTDLGAEALGVKVITHSWQAIRLINQCFGRGYRVPRRSKYDRQWGFILFQTFVHDVKEWRVVRIGLSFFAYQKGKRGEFHSGSKQKIFSQPPEELLDFARQTADAGDFDCMALDIFETPEGEFLVNEMQAYFGALVPEMLKVGGTPGRYLYDSNAGTYKFEAGEFARNACCNLRLELALDKLGLPTTIKWSN